jgi:hypothetical protein
LEEARSDYPPDPQHTIHDLHVPLYDHLYAGPVWPITASTVDQVHGERLVREIHLSEAGSSVTRVNGESVRQFATFNPSDSKLVNYPSPKEPIMQR